MEIPRTQREHYLSTFDGWRAIAATLVILAHLSGQELQPSQLWQRVSRMNWGSAGVNIFFALSGFLITYLMLVENKSNGFFNLPKFWIRRVFRIIPLTWTYVITISLFTIFGFHVISLSDLAPAFFFYENYAMGLHYAITWPVAHTWSLGVEMQFYLFWSLLVWMAGCRCIASLSLCCAILIAAWRWYAGHLGFDINVWRTDFGAGSLFCGAFFGSIYFESTGRQVLKRCLRPWSLLFILPALIYVVGWQPHGYLTFEPILMGLMITSTLVNASHNFFHWMEWKLLTWLGRISFSVYIWQQMFTGAGLFHSTTVVELPFSLICLIVTAWLSYRYIEVPGIRLGTWLNKRDSVLTWRSAV